jgi:hypothetical protein
VRYAVFEEEGCDCPAPTDHGAGASPFDQCPEVKSAARVPEADHLCAGVANCASTSGQPDHQGCPNTCACTCVAGQCYAGACTEIGGCSEPSQYR